MRHILLSSSFGLDSLWSKTSLSMPVIVTSGLASSVGAFVQDELMLLVLQNDMERMHECGVG
jgi:hypothetical protein